MNPPELARTGLDRSTDLRKDQAWLAEAWRDPGTRVLVVDDGRVLVDGSEQHPRLVFVDSTAAPTGDQLFLGTSDGSARGTAYFAVAGPLLDGRGARQLTLRDVGALLGDGEAGLLTHAVSLTNWHASHRCCPACGAVTEPVLGGSVRRCSVDGSDHFPRVDPAVIMLVHDGGDRVVLGHAPGWPNGRYSVLAGFVEPGEAAEHAVAREVAEEVGLAVSEVTYAGSQPWPFPSSLMLGFTARAPYGDLRLEPEELADARWFRRDEVREQVVTLPSAVSIARWLLDAWLADG